MQINNRLKIASILLCLAGVLSGCVDHTPVSPPKVTRDIDATEKFLVTLTIGEPGVFDHIEAQAAYSIANTSECVPMDHSIALGGVRPVALEKIDLPVTQVGERKFRTEALQHPFLDEDYYALGSCRWVISWISFDIHHLESSQSATLTRDEIKNSKTQHALCFLNPPRSGRPCGSPEYIAENIRHLFFPVTIESHKE